MTPLEIKILLMRQLGTAAPISTLARVYAETHGVDGSFDCLRKQFSMCVNKVRIYPHLQQFIADVVGKPVEQLFGAKPRRKAA